RPRGGDTDLSLRGTEHEQLAGLRADRPAVGEQPQWGYRYRVADRNEPHASDLVQCDGVAEHGDGRPSRTMPIQTPGEPGGIDERLAEVIDRFDHGGERFLDHRGRGGECVSDVVEQDDVGTPARDTAEDAQ